MSSQPDLSRRELLSVVGVSATSLVCGACSSNPFAGLGSKGPELDSLLNYDQPLQLAQVVIPPPREYERRIVLRQRFLKHKSDKKPAKGEENVAYEFEPRQRPQGLPLAKLDEAQFAALEKHSQLREHGRIALTTVVNQPAYNMLTQEMEPDLPLMALTPLKLVDNFYRIRFDRMPSGAALLRRFEFDVRPNLWYAIPIVVRRVSNGDHAAKNASGSEQEHIYCIRLEPEEFADGNVGAVNPTTLIGR